MVNVAELPKYARNLQCTVQAIHTRSRSNSCIDEPTFGKAGRLNHQNVEEEFCLQTGDEMQFAVRNAVQTTIQM